MVHGGRESALTAKPFGVYRVLGQAWRDHLESAHTIQGQVAGAVDDAHPAVADFGFDAVARELSSRRQPVRGIAIDRFGSLPA
jgi:hypothetical protein